ncbi:MAG: hypothetical protein PF692_05765 [Kiritimatiellae bacterium]|jgi:hypothetical protein|nr:hypothetical protein [Kiritimatiellia bacterium]
MSVKRIIIVTGVVCLGVFFVFPMFTRTTRHKYPPYNKVHIQVVQIEQAFKQLIVDNHNFSDVFPVNEDFKMDDSVCLIMSGSPPEDLGWRNTIYIEMSEKEKLTVGVGLTGAG